MADLISNQVLNLGGMSSALFGFLNILKLVTIILLPLIIVAVVIYLKRAYPVKAIIFKKRGDSSVIVEDWIGRGRGKIDRYVFRSRKNKPYTIEPIPYELFHIGKRKTYVFLMETEAGHFVPVKDPKLTETNDPLFRPVNRAVRFWEEEAYKANRNKYDPTSKFMQYAPLIGVFGAGIIILLMVLVVMGDMSEIAKMLTQAMGNYAKVVASTAPESTGGAW